MRWSKKAEKTKRQYWHTFGHMATECCLSELKDPSSIPERVARFIIDKTSDSGISIAKIVGKAIIAAYGLEWE